MLIPVLLGLPIHQYTLHHLVAIATIGGLQELVLSTKQLQKASVYISGGTKTTRLQLLPQKKPMVINGISIGLPLSLSHSKDKEVIYLPQENTTTLPTKTAANI
ncbi:hypothetical protein [Tolypothrix sp. NIES-4075]|uniref:hypothetical protein n=1 Tax=Tolypothrix sp. NIES-4075 TaxID=2005459 RepID=UPI001F3AE039|nr:hypothetical protein [Tolypothrix sp. NIES-4075]